MSDELSHGKTEPMLRNTPMSDETPEVVELNRMGDKPTAPARAWFPDEEGYQGEPIEYGGQLFYPREVRKADLKSFAKTTQRLQKAAVALGKQQEAEEKKADGEELPDERLEYYDAETEKIFDALDAAYNSLLEKGIKGWNLPREFSKELLFSLPKSDRVELCQRIGERSTTGIESAKNSRGRSNR